MFLADAEIRYLVTQHIAATIPLYHKEPSHDSDLNVDFSLQQKKKVQTINLNLGGNI